MRKFYSLVLIAAGLLIGTSMWAGPAKVALTREANPDMPQVEKRQMAEPQPFAMVAAQQGVSARKLAPRKAALSTEAITDDQVLLKVGETEIGLKSIVDAFKYVNANCSATDSATIILQKDIDLAYTDWQSTGAGVSLAAGKKAMLDLNGFNFTSSINTGTGWGNDNGKGTCLIQNNGIMYIQDNTFDASTADLLPENNLAPTQHAIIFFEETPDACKTHNDYPYYASNAVSNYGNLTISNCKILNNSKGSACYCIDHQNSARNISLWVESGYLFSKYANAVRQYLTSGNYTNNFTLNGGVLVGGGACVWTQFNKGTGDPTSVTNFSGGKCIAGYGVEDGPSQYYAYYNYPYTGVTSMKNVTINLSGTEFTGLVYLLGIKNQAKGDGLTVNVYGGKFNNYVYLWYNNVTMNIYDGTFGDIYPYQGAYKTLNIEGGTFEYVEDYKSTDNIINITGGTFNNSVYNYCSNHTIFNVSGGLFKSNLFLDYSYGNSEINISGGTFCKPILDPYADYFEVDYGPQYATKNKIVVTDGLFRHDIYELKYSRNTSDIKVMGGYYAFDAYTDAQMYYINYIPEGYTKIGDGITPWTEDDESYYFYKVGQENKTPADINEEGKIVVLDGEGGTREPEPTDNVIITKDNPSEEGDNTYGRDTLYLDNLDVNGITFAGRDTIDVIAKPGSIVNVGSSGIKASDTTTVYMTVEGGGAMKVGVEAIQKVDTIIVKSDANGNGTLLISPNAQLTDAEKSATVKLYVDGARKIDDTHYVWQHIAVPTDGTGTFTVENDRKATDPDFRTHVQWWNQALTTSDKWHQINSWEEMNKPWQGFILTTNSTTPGVTYSFTGNIIGNNDGQLHFDAKGYNFFGNSYTAPINVQTMLNGISNGEDIEMTVWIYSAEKVKYLESNNLMRLLGMAEFDQISSMQGFWLRNMTDSYGKNTSVNYTNAVWNNPGAMGNPKVHAPARHKMAAEMGVNVAQVIVSAEGREDKLALVEGSDYTEGFDNGCDASKMLDEQSFNIYASTGVGNLACVATDNIAGTILSFKAAKAGEYTMSFANLNGEKYAIYDMQTGVTTDMTEGGLLTFTADAGVNEGRFMVVPAKNITTGDETVKAASNVKGVYTLLGQFVAPTREWSHLPAGVYVVDGQKVVK